MTAEAYIRKLSRALWCSWWSSGKTAKADNMRAAFGEQADRNCRGRAAEEGAGQAGRGEFPKHP